MQSMLPPDVEADLPSAAAAAALRVNVAVVSSGPACCRCMLDRMPDQLPPNEPLEAMNPANINNDNRNIQEEVRILQVLSGKSVVWEIPTSH